MQYVPIWLCEMVMQDYNFYMKYEIFNGELTVRKDAIFMPFLFINDIGYNT